MDAVDGLDERGSDGVGGHGLKRGLATGYLHSYMYRPLEVDGAVEYVAGSSLIPAVFERGEPLEGINLAVGNVNLVYRVRSMQRARSVVVKQALTHARRFPEFKMPLARAHVEHALLSEHARRCPSVSRPCTCTTPRCTSTCSRTSTSTRLCAMA